MAPGGHHTRRVLASPSILPSLGGSGNWTVHMNNVPPLKGICDWIVSEGGGCFEILGISKASSSFVGEEDLRDRGRRFEAGSKGAGSSVGSALALNGMHRPRPLKYPSLHPADVGLCCEQHGVHREKRVGLVILLQQLEISLQGNPFVFVRGTAPTEPTGR